MANKWNKQRLGDVCEINQSKRGNNWKHPIIEYIDISSVGVGHFVDKPNIISINEAPSRAQRLVQDGDTIVSTVRPNRRSMLYIKSPKPNTVVSTGFAVLHPKKIDSRFLYYSVFDQEFTYYLTARADGSAYPAVSPEVISDAELDLPSLSEQRAIAGILGALDDKIEVNRRMNATLESMARTVFRQWFVENEEVDDWEVGRLGDVIKVNERGISKDYPYSEIEYIDISSVTTGRLENITPYSLSDVPSRAKRLVKHGDTIWSTVRPNRKSYLYISNPKDNLIVSTGFAVLTPEKIPPSYLYLLTTTDSFVDYLVSNADGSAYPAVGAERFADAEVLLPPKDVLDKFENIVGIMLFRIAHNEKESRTLGSLRDSLLPKLMRGEVRVEEVEK